MRQRHVTAVVTTVAVLAVAGAAALVTTAPLGVLLGARRLLIVALLATAASTTIGRTRLPDLSTAAVAGLGAYAGGVTAGLGWWSLPVGVAVATVSGALAGAMIAAIAARVGVVATALATLAAGLAITSGLRVWPAGGGDAGFHAVPLLTRSDAGDVGVLFVALAVAIALVTLWFRSSWAARARTGLGAPHVARALGHPAWRSVALAGALSGAGLGLTGVLGAAATGSVAPAGYGLGLAASVALAVVVGGRSPLAGLIGSVIVWGPSTIWPTVPWVGEDPLLFAGPIALAVVLVRRRRPPPAVPASTVTAELTGPLRRLGLERVGVPVRGGQLIDVVVAPGEIVAVVGPNGAGKSTLLALLGGQLRWPSATRRSAPTTRSNATFVARTWQRDPDLDLADALRTALAGGDAGTAAWAASVLGPHSGSAAGQQLVRLAARRPSVALLDEPSASLPTDEVASFIRGLASVGTAVVVVEHRPELVAIADRVIDLAHPADPESGGAT